MYCIVGSLYRRPPASPPTHSGGAMRIALVSEIQSNLAALEAVLRHAEDSRALEGVWSMGDVVGYGPQPNEVIALLAGQAALGVTGNHDLAATGRIETDE